MSETLTSGERSAAKVRLRAIADEIALVEERRARALREFGGQLRALRQEQTELNRKVWSV